jgi:hypothetical protein
MQTLAMGSKLAFLLRQAALRRKVPLAVLPGKALLGMLPDAPLFVVILRVVGAALTVQLAF